MSEAPLPTGFGTRLLHRAEGRLDLLRPHMTQTFGPAAAHAAPLLERIEEVSAPSHSSTPPAAARDSSQQPSRHVETRIVERQEFRLMPEPLGRHRAVVTVNDPAAPADAVGEAAVAADDEASESPLVTPDVVYRPQQAARFSRRPAQQPDSLAAAVRQLLGPLPAEPGAPVVEVAHHDISIADMTAQPGHTAPVQDAPVVMPGEGKVAADASSPLRIHIGELVIAPEPRATRPTASAPPAWQPPLSLADYRASRTRVRS